MSCIIKLNPGNSIDFEMALTNPEVSPIYVNDATVTATITDASDVDVTGQTWPVTLDYVTGSDGVYKKTIGPVSGIAADTVYKVIFDVTGAGGLIAQWVHTVTSSVRGCD